MRVVSVVIPTYKNRGGLLRSIDSVLAQECEAFVEVIVVDDNAPDSVSRQETGLVMKQFVDNEHVVYICHEANKNGAAARNSGVRASHGDYIAFLDDDDLFLPGKLQKQIEYLDRNQSQDAVYCFAQRDGQVVSTKMLEGDGTREILLLESNYFTPSLMFRRSAVEAIRGFDETFPRHQDYDLMLRFFAAGYRIGCIPEVLIEIGLNAGENIPQGEKINQLKDYFFDKFGPFVSREDAKTPGFARVVYGKHYASVFLSHLKHGHYVLAIQIFSKYIVASPRVFIGSLLRSAVVHLKRL